MLQLSTNFCSFCFWVIDFLSLTSLKLFLNTFLHSFLFLKRLFESFSQSLFQFITHLLSGNDFLSLQINASKGLTKEGGGSKDLLTNTLNSVTNGFTALNSANNDEFSFTWFYIKTLLILGVIAVALFYIFKFLRRSINQTAIDNPFYQVVFNFPLLPNGQHASSTANKNIMIVKIVNHFYILAASSDGVNLLEKITDKETIDTLVIEGDKDQVGKPASFVDKMFEILKTKGYQKKMIDPLATTKNIKDKIKNI